MTLTAYLTALLRRWKSFVALGLIGGLAGFAAFMVVPKTYESRVAYHVAFPAVANVIQSATVAKDRMPTYVEMAESDAAAHAAIANRGITGTADSAASALVSASSQTGSAVLTIALRGTNQTLVKQLADGYSATFGNFVTGLENTKTVQNVKLVVISGPTEPQPIAPNWRTYVLLGALAGLAIAFAWALIGAYRDRTVRTAAELRMLVGAPVLGRLQAASEDPVVDEPTSASAESYRRVRVNLQYQTPEARVVVLAPVVAGTPDLGRVAANLAAAFAESGEETLLVDADLREPQVCDALGLAAGPGYSEVLQGSTDAKAMLHEWHGVDVLGAGTVVGALVPSLVGGTRPAEALADLRGDYERVLVLGTPLDSVVDSLGLAKAADGVVLVAPVGVDRTVVRAAARTLAAVGARNLGTVSVAAAPLKRA